MIKTRRHQKGSLVAVAHNGLWWPGSSPLTEQSRVTSSHLLAAEAGPSLPSVYKYGLCPLAQLL